MMAKHNGFNGVTEDDWTLEERELLRLLRRERVPPPDLKARTIDAVRRYNAIASQANGSPRRVMALVAAAAGIFIGGALVGFAAARHSTPPNSSSPVTTHQAVAGADHEALTMNRVRYVLWY